MLSDWRHSQHRRTRVLPSRHTITAVENIPEPQRLIRGRCANTLPVRTLAHMQHSHRVAGKLPYFGHGWKFPEDQLVVAESMTGEELAVMVVELHCTHLRAGVDRAQTGTCGGVPNSNRSIRCAASENKYS